MWLWKSIVPAVPVRLCRSGLITAVSATLRAGAIRESLRIVVFIASFSGDIPTQGQLFIFMVDIAVRAELPPLLILIAELCLIISNAVPPSPHVITGVRGAVVVEAQEAVTVAVVTNLTVLSSLVQETTRVVGTFTAPKGVFVTIDT